MSSELASLIEANTRIDGTFLTPIPGLHLSRYSSRTQPGQGVVQCPTLAIVAQGVWSCVLVATNSYRALFSRVVYTEWLFFALLAAGLFVLRRRREYSPTVLTRGYQPVAILFIITSLSIAVNQCFANPRDSALGLGLLILGLPVYFVWARKR